VAYSLALSARPLIIGVNHVREEGIVGPERFRRKPLSARRVARSWKTGCQTPEKSYLTPFEAPWQTSGYASYVGALGGILPS